jgi:hypothetical protein
MSSFVPPLTTDRLYRAVSHSGSGAPRGTLITAYGGVRFRLWTSNQVKRAEDVA